MKSNSVLFTKEKSIIKYNGSNHIDSLKEGFRILNPYGSLFICEPKKKAQSRMENLKKEIEDCGFKIIEVKENAPKVN